MKKNLLFVLAAILLFAFSASASYSQSLELIDNEPHVAYTLEDEGIKSHLEFKNIGMDTVTFSVAVIVKQIQPGSMYYFCDLNACWPDKDIDFSTSGNVLAPDSTTGAACYVGFKHNGVSGKNIFNYKVTNANDDSDSFDFDITFDFINGIEDEVQVPLVAAPNPASDFIVFSGFEKLSVLGTSLYVYDVEGNLVANELNINSNPTLTLNTMNYQNGTYYYSIVSGTSIIKSGAFIVNK
jgi:Secretion system C-terminal sorting domain